MQQTTNYNLNKFDSTDALESATRVGLNENADIIDGALTGLSEATGISYDNTESGLTAETVQGAIDEISQPATTTTAGLMSASDKEKLDGIGTVELLKTQTLTTTWTTYSLDTGKSFTDYSFILIENMVAGETRARGSVLCAYSVNGGVLMQVLHGGLSGTITDGWKVSSATITFLSETTFQGYLSNSGAINQVKIYGVK